MRVDKTITRANVAAAQRRSAAAAASAYMCSVLYGNHAKAAQRRYRGGNCGLSRICFYCTHTSRGFMLVSCPRDVFIHPGQLRVVLTNNITVPFETRKPTPIKTNWKMWTRLGHYGPVFLEVQYIFGIWGI